MAVILFIIKENNHEDITIIDIRNRFINTIRIMSVVIS